MTFGDRLKKLRKDKNVTQDELAEAIGVTINTVYRYESKNVRPRGSTLDKIANFFGVSTEYLLYGERTSENGITVVPAVNVVDKNYFKLIPIYGNIEAGTPIESITDIQGYTDIPFYKLKPGKDYIALRVQGDSMYPFYLDGDVVIIELTSTPINGSVCAVYIDEYNVTLKKFKIDEKEGIVELVPFNREYPKIKRNLKDHDVQVLGQVIQLRRDV